MCLVDSRYVVFDHYASWIPDVRVVFDSRMCNEERYQFSINSFRYHGTVKRAEMEVRLKVSKFARVRDAIYE